MMLDPTNTRRRLMGLIAQGLGPTTAWDYHLVNDLEYTAQQVADMRGVTSGAVRGNYCKACDLLGIEKDENDV